MDEKLEPIDSLVDDEEDTPVGAVPNEDSSEVEEDEVADTDGI